jgi:hypothetical protein
MTTMQIRQGDVWLERVSSLEGQEIAPTERGLVLQEGERTGHAHRIRLSGPTARHASLYRTETDARYLRVVAPVELTHEEHVTRCASCLAEARARGVTATIEESIATRRVVGDFDAAAYRCARHDANGIPMVELSEPGATVIPTGNYQITIHAEYQPGELPRQVED